MVQVGDTFDSIHDAHKAIKSYILTQAELYKTVASNKARYILACKDADCRFKIRVWKLSKDIVSIMAFNPHTCSLATHYKLKQTSLVWHLIFVTALLAVRNQHPWTKLALDALGICFTDALYTLCGQALQTSLACDRELLKGSSLITALLLLLPSLALDSCITDY